MTKITVVYEIQTDANNRREAINKYSYNSNRKEKAFDRQKGMVNIIDGKTKTEAKKDLIPFLQKYRLENQKEFDKRISIAQKIFDEDGQKILDRIAEITKYIVDYKEIIMFMTTYPRCPYHWEKGYIRLGFKMSPERIKLLLAHEVLHFQFHRYYSDLPEVKLLTQGQYETLKESLTFLLNYEFENMGLGMDQGYPIHQEFRNRLKEYRLSSDKNFISLVKWGANEVVKN